MQAVKSRREEYADQTRRALLDAARALFSQHGYQSVSLDQIARAARVTKGALYHHFDGKEQLFEAVYEDVCDELMAKVAEVVIAGGGSTWDAAIAGMTRYLEGCADAGFRRLAFEDAPAVFGTAKWRAIDDKHASGLLREVVQTLVDGGELEPLPVEILARVLFGALKEGAQLVGAGVDKREVERVLTRTMEGLRPAKRKARARDDPAS